MLQPRPYQEEAQKKVLQRWKKGITRQLISLPTGCGKTIIFGMLAESLRERTLVLAHREELLLQAKQKIRLVYPDADIGILKAQDKSGLDAEICIASVQTAVRHTKALSDRSYKFLICDEAHHAVSPSYMNIFSKLGFMEDDKSRLLLGVTATAYRGDKVGLGELFQEIVFERSILAMMRAGYLCDVKGLSVKTETDISHVHTRTGDLAVDELSDAIDTPERNALIADAYIQHGEGRKGVVFGVKVEHALNLAEAFRKRKIPCAAVWGDMPIEERHDVLKRYAEGKLQVLTNVGVLTEGWDVPETDIIMMARPTKSRGLYIQCVGRGLRIAPGKRNCLLIDFVDVARQHKLCGFGTLAGGNFVYPGGGEKTLLQAIKEAEKEERAKAREKKKYKFASQTEVLDLFERSHFVWQTIGQNYKLGFGNNTLWCKAVPGGYSAFEVQASKAPICLSDDVLPLGYAMGICEDHARQMESVQNSLKTASWREDPASDKQREALRKMGILFEEDVTKGEASDLLSKQWDVPLTDAQKKFIQEHNLYSEPEFLTKHQASKLIDKFKNKKKRKSPRRSRRQRLPGEPIRI